jgi:uncharacterized protein YbaA (DUF1428 family)
LPQLAVAQCEHHAFAARLPAGAQRRMAMSYIDGMLIPATTSRKADYLKMSQEWHGLFKEYGATRVVECWGDDVPDGKVTDFKRAVQAEPTETVVFTWVEWPSKAVRDAANEKMRTDPRMKMSSDMPFSMQRMIFGGFEVIVDSAGTLVR